ncbi:MAG TPA: ribonuclease HII [Thermoanaerobacterales bacterium]|nr:ribonuclease HII [Thermoanaerobacterales bacterium]
MKNMSLKEINKLLQAAELSEAENYIDILSTDSREKVKELAARFKKTVESEKTRLNNLLLFEKKAYELGYKLVVGVDEAGRGPLAGPVVAAAVIFPKGIIISGIDDSKKLSPRKRELLYHKIKEKALYLNVEVVDEKYIDKYNILNASIKAIKDAVEGLEVTPDYVLIDGNDNNIFDFPHRCIVKGDSRSFSIAAASIVAKVERDKLMMKYDKIYPGYGFGKHKGYGTREHIKNIKEYGLCPIHRRSFKIKSH